MKQPDSQGEALAIVGRKEVFDTLAAIGIKRDSASCTEFESAKQYLANEWFADSAEYDLMISLIEEYVGL